MTLNKKARCIRSNTFYISKFIYQYCIALLSIHKKSGLLKTTVKIFKQLNIAELTGQYLRY